MGGEQDGAQAQGQKQQGQQGDPQAKDGQQGQKAPEQVGAPDVEEVRAALVEREEKIVKSGNRITDVVEALAKLEDLTVVAQPLSLQSEGAESGLPPGSAPFIKLPYLCTTVQQTEMNKRNTLIHLLATKHGCSDQGSDSGNQSACATDKSETVTGLGQVALCRLLTLVVAGVGVCVRIGRGIAAVASATSVAPVFTSTGLSLCLPACIQGELGLSVVHSGIEVISPGAVLVGEPSREDIALPGGIGRLYHFVTNGNKLRVNRRTLVGIKRNGNLQNLGSLSARFLCIAVGTLGIGKVNNCSVSIGYGIGCIALHGFLFTDSIFAVGKERGQAALEVLNNLFVWVLAAVYFNIAKVHFNIAKIKIAVKFTIGNGALLSASSRRLLFSRGIPAVGLDRCVFVALRREGATGDGDLVEAIVVGTVDDGTLSALSESSANFLYLGSSVAMIRWSHKSCGSYPFLLQFVLI